LNRTHSGKTDPDFYSSTLSFRRRCGADVELKWGCRISCPQLDGIDEGWKLLMRTRHKKYQSGSRIALERDFKIGFVK
jgi:hypothetical protein